MISVIIPLYNVESYIVRCLESFENQTYKNFEIIVVNDGSTDNSKIVVEEYMQKSNMKLKLLDQSNKGVSAARNKGIIEANGDLICFVDSDDMVVSEYLAQLEENLNNTNSDMVICAIKFIEDDYSNNLYNYVDNSVVLMDSDEALNRYLYKKITCGIGSFLIKKSILKDNNLLFSETYRYSEDQELIWKMISLAKKIAYNKNFLYLYRLRPNSAMSKVDEQRLDGLKLMFNLEKYFKDTNPVFYEKFKKYGVARWVWATTWQAALGSNNFKAFRDLTELFQTETYMKKLLTFPENKVRISSIVYFFSPRLYFIIVRSILNMRDINSGS